MLRNFIRENKNTIKIVAYLIATLAGFMLIVYRRPLPGVLLLLVGLTLLAITVGKILGNSDYAGGDGSLNGWAGMGRQQSSVNKVSKTEAPTETTAAIWDQMKSKEDATEEKHN